MHQSLGETESFIRSLGVTIVEVDDLGGQCAVYSPSQRQVRVCSGLCERRRGVALANVLAELVVA